MSVEVGTAWKARSAELAEWAFQNLANRFDGWGQYSRGENARSWTAKGELSRGLLAQHFSGAMTIGLHNVAPDQLLRWCVWDFDLHGDYDEAKAKHNLDQAVLVERTLAELGATALIHDSNGKGGYHVWLFFNKPRFCWDVHAWGREFGKKLELDTHEFYPKQPRINEWGNFVRLFGRHHRHDHWSRFLAPPDTWLEGEEAIDWLLGIEPADVDAFIPETTAAATTPVLPFTAQPDGPRPDGLANIDKTLYRDAGDDGIKAMMALRKISPTRADIYDEWVKVGMALHSVDQSSIMLGAWDSWSRQSPKYTFGDCAAKWSTFKDTTLTQLGLGTLIKWAREDQSPIITDNDRERIWKALGEELSAGRSPIVITDIIRYNSVDSTFTMVLDGVKNVFLGGTGDVKNFNKIDNAICGSTEEYLDDSLKKDWKGKFAQRIVKSARLVETGSEEEETKSWLQLALSGNPLINCTTEEMLQKAQHVRNQNIGFIWEGISYIRLEALIRFLKIGGFGNPTPQELGRRLSAIGFKKITFNFHNVTKKIDVECRVWTKREEQK